jgi:RNA polymerase sigma-70 factor (ECF subfamily)
MSNYAHLSDEDLLTRLRAGDEEALSALYRRRQGAIYRFAWQMSGSEQTAEDVTQDVFLALINGAAAFDARKGSLLNYLYGAARFQILRRWERERWFAPLGDDADEGDDWLSQQPDTRADLFSQTAQREIVGRVREAVLRLPPHYREVVVLCDLHELDYATAANVTGCALGTVRSRLHRARSLLANKLRECVAEAPEESVAPAPAWA